MTKESSSQTLQAESGGCQKSKIGVKGFDAVFRLNGKVWLCVYVLKYQPTPHGDVIRYFTQNAFF